MADAQRGAADDAPDDEPRGGRPVRWPRPCSASGVMVASIDSPQGDQVERTAADEGDETGGECEDDGHGASFLRGVT